MAMMIERKDLELNLLRTFLAVVQHGSMGRTATAVARTQPAVSQQILRLEKIIGRKLFYRSRSGVKLTGHRELLVAYANRAIDLNDEALAQLREESASGPLSLCGSEQSALAGLTPTLKRFQRTQTDVDLKVLVGAQAKLVFLLTKARDLMEMALTTSIEAAAGTRPVHSLEGPSSDKDSLSSGSRLLELGVAGLPD